jgi:cytidylate kinase
LAGRKPQVASRKAELTMIIAIDGPSGVGKGTVARAVAGALGYRHVDTGSMYRGVAWRALHDRVSLDDEPALTALAERLVIDIAGGGIRVDGVDVRAAIRNPEIDRAAALVARVPGVRAALVAVQRRIGESGSLVMEGRDIGTVVFPGADVKIYLDASSEERARRRVHDEAHDGCRNMAQVAADLAARDKSDRTRAVAPLSVARDAHVIDTTGLRVDEVVARVLALVRAATLP